MTQLALGPGLTCDLARLVDTRLLVQANSGGGKSWFLRRLLEQSHGHIQQLVLDREGEFSSLRERYDYVLAAKRGGDTAAEVRAAPLLAERLLELGVSAIIDIYDLRHAERVQFVTAFLSALVNLPKRLWHPCLIVLDESHIFAPERGTRKGYSPSTEAVIDLTTLGRKRGFCAVLATQRLSKLSNDAAAECNNILIGRTGLDVDAKRACDTLGIAPKEGRALLRDLAPGEFYAFGPAFAREPLRVQIGPVVTTHPKAGARIAFTPPPPTAKVRALLPQLADLPAEAEEEARTADDLRRLVGERDRRIRELERMQPPPPEPPKVERVEVPVVDPALAERLVSLGEALVGGVGALAELHPQLEARAVEIKAAAQQLAGPRETAPPARPLPRQQAPSVRPVAEPAPRPPARPRAAEALGDFNGKLTGPEQRILDALAWLEQIGVSPAENPAVAFLAGYSHRGSAYTNPRGALRSRGLIGYHGGGLVLTGQGRALSHAPETPLTAEELHRRVLDKLPGPEQRILTPLLAAYPQPLPNEELARLAEYSPDGSAYTNPRGRLRTLGLIDYPAPGLVVAQQVLFPEER